MFFSMFRFEVLQSSKKLYEELKSSVKILRGKKNPRFKHLEEIEPRKMKHLEEASRGKTSSKNLEE